MTRPLRSLQRVLAVRVDVDDNASLFVERNTSSSNDGGGDDRVLDSRQSIVVKVLWLGFSLVDLDTARMGTVGCLVSGGFGQSAARLNSPGLDPSAQADITVSSLAVKGTVGSRGVLHVETAIKGKS